MAFNLENMTVSYKSLLNLVPTQRTQLAQSGSINDIISALSPGQLVSLFPRYYRDQLPDLGKVNRYNSGLDVALSGGTNPRNRNGSGNGNAGYPESQNIDRMKAKLLESGINVDGIYDTVGTGILKNDPRVKFIRSLSPDELEEHGFEEFQDENGKTLIKAQPIDVPEDIADGNRIGSVGTGMDLPVDRRKELVFNAVLGQLKAEGFEAVDIRGVAAMLAGQPEQESGYDPTAQHDKDKVTGEYTGYGIYGARNDRRTDMFDWLAKNGYKKDDLIGQARYMAHEAVNDPEYRKFMDNMAGMELTKMAKNNPDQFREVMLGFTKNFEGPLVPTSGLENRIRGATDTFNMKEENVIAMNEETYTEYIKRERENKLLKKLYNSQNDPTAIPISTNGIRNPVGGSQEGTSILDTNVVPRSGSGGPDSRVFGGPRDDMLHTGVDIPGKVGDPVRAPADGTIRKIYRSGGSGESYGYVMDIEYPDGTVHRYAHLGTDDGGPESAYAKGQDGKPLKVGDRVVSGQTFGYVGESGNANYDFPHVHMEVIKKKYYEETGGLPPGRESTRESLEKGRIDPFEWYKQQEERLKKAEEAKKAAQTTSPAPAPVATTVQPAGAEVQSETITPDPPPPVINSRSIGMPAQDQNIDNPIAAEEKFYANNGKDIKITPPGTIENNQQMPVNSQEDVKNLETPMQAINTEKQPVYRDNPDPNLYNQLTGNYYVPPSQLRATNRARLQGDDSSSMINNHFS